MACEMTKCDITTNGKMKYLGQTRGIKVEEQRKPSRSRLRGICPGAGADRLPGAVFRRFVDNAPSNVIPFRFESDMSRKEPTIHVGIMDRKGEMRGRFNGPFTCEEGGLVSGGFVATVAEGMVRILNESGQTIAHSPRLVFAAGPGSTFSLFDVIIGERFHWERSQDQSFPGNLLFQRRDDGTLTAINEVPLEEYLESVISSEMNGRAPLAFLKTHAILSRSWLLSSLERRRKPRKATRVKLPPALEDGEIVRWYDREDHDLFDVCADDHCQRYHGLMKIISDESRRAVADTRGTVVTYGGKICDARYSKACGGLTERYSTAWDSVEVPYLASIPDGPTPHPPVASEEDATRWILSAPDAYCHTTDREILSRILPDFDRETDAFFRWTVRYTRNELSKIVKAKSGLDFGDLLNLVPLARGPSGRIHRLGIEGSKMSIVVGKELEIRRWLSESHLYSSAFIVKTERNHHGEVDSYVLQGAGWGHGVGLCQIGAAVMASRGFSAEEILTHYFTGAAIEKVY
jgi:stage II sporulation protein D